MCVKCGKLVNCDYKSKPLAQFLAEHIAYNIYGHDVDRWGTTKWRELLEQALDAYESTKNAKIKIEKQ